MIASKKKLTTGLLLMVSFVCVFIVIFMPIFGQGRNGLQFSDDLFNKLSKGSSYFIPKVRAELKKVEGKQIAVGVKFKDPAMAKTADVLLAKVGATGELKGEVYEVKGDLGKMLAKVVADCDLMYKDDGKPVAEFYGMDEKKAMKGWYTLLAAMIQPMQRQKLIEEANVVNLVNQKAMEPAYNFYGIPAEHIATKIPTVTALLLFYVIYTLWYGFAIFDIFNGFGLSMSKSKIKKEA
jgi:preprotein translocase subunit SecE